MKKLSEAVKCIMYFGSAVDFKGLKKIYKKAALLVHSDRARSNECPYTMTDVNNAWKLIVSNKQAAMGMIKGSDIQVEASRAANAWKDDPLHEANVPSFFSVATMAKKKWNIIEDGEIGDFVWFNPSSHSTYIKKSNLEYRYYYGGDVISLYNLDFAFKARKVCKGYKICHQRNTDADFMEVWSLILDELCERPTPEGVWSWLSSLEMVDNGPYSGVCAEVSVNGSVVRIYSDDIAGNKMFSPFDVERVKPVQVIPKKWTVVHLRKLLANGQFSNYKQDFYYTDDYFQDSASNFRKGYFQNPLSSYVDILKCSHVRLWSRTSEDGTVTLNFGEHSNDGRSLIVELENRYPMIDMEDEEKQYLKGDIVLL